jgi:two-component system, OmpR family, response regulator
MLQPGESEAIENGQTVDHMRILVIEDDRDAATWLMKGLRESGHVADLAANGEDGLAMALESRHDMLVVDRMLPKMDGLTIIRTLRAKGITTPALILSALSDVDERVKGLRAGGDDYLAKPYAFSELLARIEGLRRRNSNEPPETKLKAGDLELDLLTRQVTRGGQVIPLQPREFKLLEYLMRNEGHIVTRTMLLENVWDYHFDPQTNVIDVHISRLRAKIEKGFATSILQTVRGAGYMIRAL